MISIYVYIQFIFLYNFYLTCLGHSYIKKSVSISKTFSLLWIRCFSCFFVTFQSFAHLMGFSILERLNHNSFNSGTFESQFIRPVTSMWFSFSYELFVPQCSLHGYYTHSFKVFKFHFRRMFFQKYSRVNVIFTIKKISLSSTHKFYLIFS